jgi:hypothetical protein
MPSTIHLEPCRSQLRACSRSRSTRPNPARATRPVRCSSSRPRAIGSAPHATPAPSAPPRRAGSSRSSPSPAVSRYASRRAGAHGSCYGGGRPLRRVPGLPAARRVARCHARVSARAGRARSGKVGAGTEGVIHCRGRRGSVIYLVVCKSTYGRRVLAEPRATCVSTLTRPGRCAVVDGHPVRTTTSIARPRHTRTFQVCHQLYMNPSRVYSYLHSGCPSPANDKACELSKSAKDVCRDLLR